MRKIFGKSEGFTLIELIVVISIIGILSSVLVANFMQVRSKTRDGVRKKDLEQIRLALEVYRTDEGEYPDALPSCNAEIVGETSSNIYMKKTPCDPLNDDPYTYTKVSNTTYMLYACAENEKDQGAVSEGCSTPSGRNSNAKFLVTNP